MTQKCNPLNVKFWSGNRTEIRQDYERTVLEAILQSTESELGSWNIEEDKRELPGDEESKVFSEKNYDLFVTIAGNQKLEGQDFYLIEKPMAKNILGYRIPIVHEHSLKHFHSKSNESDLKKLVHGIPETWGDVKIFEESGYSVLEKGNFDDLFERLSNKEFDYTTFGANEIHSVFNNNASKFDKLRIVDDLLFYYPFPLVFYVNPNQKQLAKRIETGLNQIGKNGQLDSIFNSFFETLIKDLNLNQRTVYYLKNPFIPEVFKNLKPNFDKLIY